MAGSSPGCWKPLPAARTCATAAEARASELHAGQQSLLAAARAAGFEYTVSAGAARFTPVSTPQPRVRIIIHDDLLPPGISSETVAEAIEVRLTMPPTDTPAGDAEPCAAQPTGGETPTDRPQAAPDARQPA